MPAAYDTYNYPAYWQGRDYEHESEIIAIKAFLKKIPKIKKILEIGSGYGRLTPYYKFRANKIILADPSSKLLKIARKKLISKKIRFVHSKVENLKDQLRANCTDLVLVVRVLHHIENIDQAFAVMQNLLKKNGYLILEFANKKHLKATVGEFLKGNLTFPLEIFPLDKRSPKSVKKKTLPFVNYHPDQITEKLESLGFTIIERRSVSNIRSTKIKKILSKELLLFFEKYLQIPLSHINFGPSIFILAKNTR